MEPEHEDAEPLSGPLLEDDLELTRELDEIPV